MKETSVLMMTPWMFTLFVKERKIHYKSNHASVGNSWSNLVID